MAFLLLLLVLKFVKLFVFQKWRLIIHFFFVLYNHVYNLLCIVITVLIWKFWLISDVFRWRNYYGLQSFGLNPNRFPFFNFMSMRVLEPLSIPPSQSYFIHLVVDCILRHK